MQTLPTTAYILMIDTWLVFCQLVPFAEVILLTAQDYYRVKDHKEDIAVIGTGTEKNKDGSETLVEVMESNKTTTFEAFEDDNNLEHNEDIAVSEANAEVYCTER